MQISVPQPVFQTLFFGIFLLLLLLISIIPRVTTDLGLSSEVTEQLKGFAILGVIFCHVGYFLSTDSRFLFPFSIFAGISVNLFLFLSGYGLTMSQLAKPLSPVMFYKKRLTKLYVPFWISLAVLFCLSFFIAHIDYSPVYSIRSFFGFFPGADIFKDIDSPLWYFSFIVFFYLLFPIFFFRKRPWLSAIFLFGIAYLIVFLNPTFLLNVMSLYADHIVAFPMGIMVAWLSSLLSVQSFFYTHDLNKVTRYSILFCCIIFSSYFSYHAFIGEGILKEQTVSMCVVFALTILFSLWRGRFNTLDILGKYSYEIYLIHWPILYHYDIFFRNFSPWLAMVFSLIFFVCLGMLLKKITERLPSFKIIGD